MSESKRYVAGYLGAVFPEALAGEKAAVIAWNEGEEPDRWFADLEEGRAELRALTVEIAEGRVRKVVLRNRDVLSHNVHWNGEFFDALLETDTELAYVEQGTTNPTEKLMAQLVPLLHEWKNGEAAHFAAQGWHTLHADTRDIVWLRGLLTQNNTMQAKRWLERLLPDVGAEGWTKPADD